MWAYVHTEEKKYIVPDEKGNELTLGTRPYLWYTNQAASKWYSTGANRTCWDIWAQDNS